MGILYAENNKIYCNDYMEIYIPMQYFNDKMAANVGLCIESFGIVYTRSFPNGNEGPIQLINLPTTINFYSHNFKYESIKIKNKTIDVMTLSYAAGQPVMDQSLPNGRKVAEEFLARVLAGKIPKTIQYDKLIDIWWKNLEISGVSFKVPSKMFEMILAAIYRSPTDSKKRYGQYYASNAKADGYDYKTSNVRSVVKDLSTFSGMVFEDIGTMITNGINNAATGVEEPVSPLEKIIHY